MSNRAKIVAQGIGAAVIVFGTSVWFTQTGNLASLSVIELGNWSILTMIISFMQVMNAIDIIDGFDGLSGSVSLIPVLLIAYLAITESKSDLLFELQLFAGAILGFLSFNIRLRELSKALLNWRYRRHGDRHATRLVFRRARRLDAVNHPADQGSMDFGGTSLFDMDSIMLPRLHQRKSPVHAELQQRHQFLPKASYSVTYQVVVILVGFSLLYGVIGIAAEHHREPEVAIFVAFLALWGACVAGLKHLKGLQVIALIRPFATRSRSGLS